MYGKQLMGNVYVVFIDGLTKKIDSESVGFPKHRSKLERDFRSLDDGKLFGYMYFDQSSCMFVLRILNPETSTYSVVTSSSFDLLTSYIYKLIIVECGYKYNGGSRLYNDITKYGLLPFSNFTSVNERIWAGISGKSISNDELKSVVFMPKNIDIRYFLELLLDNIFKVFKPFYENISDPSDYNLEIINSYGEDVRHIIISDNMESCKQLYAYLNYRLLTDIHSVDIVVGFLDIGSIGKDDDTGSVYLKILTDDRGGTKDISLFIDHSTNDVISRYDGSFINQKVAVLHVLSPVKVFTDIGMPMVSYRSTSIHDMIEYINLQHEIRG